MDDSTRQVLNRWKSIQGHARGVEQMITTDVYCVDILKQTLAIQGAIEKVNATVLERHLQNCVTTAIQEDNPAERERVIRELMEVFEGSGHLRRLVSTNEVVETVEEALDNVELTGVRGHVRHSHGDGSAA